MSPFADVIGGVVNSLLAPAGLTITRAAPGQAESWRAAIGARYRTDREVIRMARERGVSVADFIEAEWGQTGRAKRTVARMREAGAVPESLGVVCEIGPGSGRYIQEILAIATVARYEICEIERSRARWLAQTYPVVALPAQGERLPATPDASVHLVHAHGVFASLNVITCLSYFKEFARITAPGGHVVFDVICEECMGDDEVKAWLETKLRYVNFLSKPFLVQFFEQHGFTLADDFRLPLMVFGQSVYLVFRKTGG